MRAALAFFLTVVLLQGCDATTSEVQVQSSSPYPYNARW
jgi:hypothetical protein